MKKLVFILLTLNFELITLNCFSQWFQQNSGTTAHLSGISFVDANTGWAVGDSGTVLKTTNGGLNWLRQNSGTNSWLGDVHFVNVNFGTAVGTNRTIIHTTNGGTNWIIQSPTIGIVFECVEFLDENTGYVAGGEDARVLKTINGGSTWINLSHSEPFSWLHGLDFVDANTGYVVGADGTLFSPIIKTTNGGINWVRQQSWTSLPLTSVSFINANTGVVVGVSGIRFTTNGGSNWVYQEDPASGHRVKLINENTGYIAGAWTGSTGAIVKTTNGGNNWLIQSSGQFPSLSGIDFINTETGWISGRSGTILHTTNGGVIGIEPISNEIPEKFHLFQNYPNPFNSTTIINFQLPIFNYVRLSIFDILGQEVEMLVNEELKRGIYEIKWNASNHPSGIYFYRIGSENYSETRKMILLR